ncbi:bolA-like protein 2 [Cricetulus griseus]|uniref:BolA-like protein 2 n=1 Tax=Cricetulus griseus TaxID=10029 RepID=A0A061IHH4_CRIGR|nr:bolA-like protein 2 [Cricetulus griseus]
MELSLCEKLRGDLEAECVEVEDTTLNHCTTSFRVLVVLAKFEGKPLLQRHRLGIGENQVDRLVDSGFLPSPPY